MTTSKYIATYLTAILFTIVSGTSAVNAQNKAMELYNNQMYQNALVEFNKIIEQSPSPSAAEQAEAYKILCSIHLRHANVDGMVNSFTTRYPASAYTSKIKYLQASAEFEKENYGKALSIYNTLNLNQIDKKQQEEFLFRKGYALLMAGSHLQAEEAFNQAVAIGDKEQRKSGAYLSAKYYLGYINYKRQDFNKAISLFNESARDVRFAQLSKYYILDSKYMLKDYSYVTQYGPELYQKVGNDAKARTARIISEAYYSTGDAANARQYFDLYSAQKGQLSQTDNFYSGIIYYTTGDYANAAASFERLAGAEDSLGQSANYHLGWCYIQLKNKKAAEVAFRNAASLDYDLAIKEDAFFNWAKLNFDLTGETSKFQEYLRRYHVTAQKNDEIQGYIATSALSQNNFSQAIEALQKIHSPTRADRLNLQKANLFKGADLLESGSYTAASRYFEAAASADVNSQVSDLARFMLAECLFRGENYASALAILKELQRQPRFTQSGQYAESFFSSGYNYFKMKDLDNAEKDFEKYLGFRQAGNAAEARLRIADCRFMNRDFATAAKMYDQIASRGDATDLYPSLQSAIAYGLMGENSRKIKMLENITVPQNSGLRLYADALYELGRTQVQTSDEEGAIATYNRLINNTQDTSYTCKALLELGMINTNRKNWEAAAGYYRQIIEKGAGSQEAQAALSALENVYQAQNRPEEFLRYVTSAGITQGENAQEQELFIFNSAEQIYLAQKYEAAAQALEMFMEKYPQSSLKEKAYAYLADIYVRTEEFAKAAEAYDMLGSLVQDTDSKINALLLSMQMAYKAKEFEEAIARADRIISYATEDKDRQEALYYKSRSLIASDKADAAKPLLKELAGRPEHPFGAEATYLLIKDSFDAGDFEDVEKQVFAFSDSKSAQTYWLAKSFILLGDSYAEKGDTRQALATYKSIRDNYKGKDEVASTVTAKIKSLEK